MTFPEQPFRQLRMLVSFTPDEPETPLSQARSLKAGEVYECKVNRFGGMFAIRGNQSIIVFGGEYELLEATSEHRTDQGVPEGVGSQERPPEGSSPTGPASSPS